MKAKASICISQDDTLIESLEIAKHRIEIMIKKGMDNEKQVLQGLVDSAEKRIAEIRSGENRPSLLMPMPIITRNLPWTLIRWLSR